MRSFIHVARRLSEVFNRSFAGFSLRFQRFEVALQAKRYIMQIKGKSYTNRPFDVVINAWAPNAHFVQKNQSLFSCKKKDPMISNSNVFQCLDSFLITGACRFLQIFRIALANWQMSALFGGSRPDGHYQNRTKILAPLKFGKWWSILEWARIHKLSCWRSWWSMEEIKYQFSWMRFIEIFSRNVEQFRK